MKESNNIFNIQVEAKITKCSTGTYTTLVGQTITATKIFKDGDNKFLKYGNNKKFVLISFDDVEFTKVEDINIIDNRSNNTTESDDISKKLKDELTEYFNENLVSNKEIVEFELLHSYPHNIYNIKPIRPMFDENYDDAKADDDIAMIGQKYNVKLAWIYWVYPKK